MVFNVYFDPKVIEVAAANPPYGLQALCAVLRAFLANCLLFDFEDYRGQTEIRRFLEATPDGFDRALAKKLFVVLAKRNRFVCLLDCMTDRSDLDQALDQAGAFATELCVTEQTPTIAIPPGVECAPLARYQTTRFEAERNNAATVGRPFAAGEMAARDFLVLNFANAFRYARRIEICDRFVGERFADNFEHTVRELFRFLEATLHEPGDCEVVFHCGQSARNQHFCHMLASFRGARTGNMPVTVQCYENAAGACLPHERYLWTDQIAFVIGRGMDFLNRATGKNRDVNIDLKDESEIAQTVAAYAPFRVQSRQI